MINHYAYEQLARHRAAEVERNAITIAQLRQAGLTAGPTFRQRVGWGLMALGRRLGGSVEYPRSHRSSAVKAAS